MKPKNDGKYYLWKCVKKQKAALRAARALGAADMHLCGIMAPALSDRLQQVAACQPSYAAHGSLNKLAAQLIHDMYYAFKFEM